MPRRAENKPGRSWASRLGWMALFWAAGVAGLALVAYLLRIFMGWAGFNA